MENEKDIIDLREIIRQLWSKKRAFLKVWAITFILACVWIFPKPRFYTCKVKLAPEIAGEDIAGGLASVASSFGINIGGASGSDAIYPMLYPDLFESPEFTVGLFDIQVKSLEGEINTDYYTYLAKHQKQDPLMVPFYKAKGWFKKLIKKPAKSKENSGHNAFLLSEQEVDIVEMIQSNISCTVDKKTDVISISVKDQDPLICATLADSVMAHLQDFIIKYRTQKARLDESYYQHLADSAKEEYYQAQKEYSNYCDAHKNAVLQSFLSEQDRLENELSIKLNTYQAMMTQLQAMKAKVQERTPAFTTLQSAAVPIRPAGPKRVIFVLTMLVLSSIVISIWFLHKQIF